MPTNSILIINSKNNNKIRKQKRNEMKMLQSNVEVENVA